MEDLSGQHRLPHRRGPAPLQCPVPVLRGEGLEARYTAAIVEIYFKNRRLASHRRRYDRQPSTLPEHMPSAHRAHAEWTPSRLIGWAQQAGPDTGRLVAGIFERRPHPKQGYRACLGLMRLGRQHPRLVPEVLQLPYRQEHPGIRPGPVAVRRHRTPSPPQLLNI